MAMYTLCYLVKLNWLAFQNSFQINIIMFPCFVSNILFLDNFIPTGLFHLFVTGPFWICTTLVFTTAIAGNLANYIQHGGNDYEWRYDFHKGISGTRSLV